MIGPVRATKGPHRRPRSRGLVSVVVPLLDEASSLWQLYEEITRAVTGELEILFVDDGSQDESFSILCAMQERDPRIRAFRLRSHQGKAVALAVGFSYARGDYVITIDADLQDDPAEIPDFIAKLDEGYDVVSGHRRHRQDFRFRKLASLLFNWTASLLSGHRFHDLAGGFKAYRREVVKELHLEGGLHRFIPILAAAQGFRATEIRTAHRARPHGRSRYGASRYMHAFLDCLAVAWDVRFGRYPSRICTFLGMSLMSLGIFIALMLGDRVGLAWRISLVSVHFMAGLFLIAQGFLAQRSRTATVAKTTQWPLREVIDPARDPEHETRVTKDESHVHLGEDLRG